MSGTGTPAPPLLAVNNIEVIYDHVILVLKGVSLRVPEGGIVALLGANGAGKSTTLKAISGLLRTERGDVTKGSIELRGKASLNSDELARNLAALGYGHYLKGNLGEAIKLYEQALQLDPENGVIAEEYLKILHASGDAARELGLRGVA